MRVQVLGDLEVRRDGVVLGLGGPKQRALVGLLVAARGRPVPIERLIDQLWGEEPPAKVMLSLHTMVAKLRRQMEPGRGPRGQAELLVTRPSGYALLLADDAVDAPCFEELAHRARGTDDQAEQERLLVEALSLWRGSAYAGLGDVSALRSEAARLAELRLSVLEQLWEARVQRGAENAVAELSVLVAEHPGRERLWALLALALYRAGRQGEALDALRRVRRYLADGLGIDPGSELQRLEQAVLHQDDTLLLPSARPAAAELAPGTEQSSHQSRATEPPPAASAGLSGRAALLQRTAEVVRQAAAGAGQIVLVTGEPGIGKSRFADAVAAQAEGAGLNVARGTWESEGCPPLWGWTTALPALGDAAFGARPVAADDTVSTTFRRAAAVLALAAARPGTCLVLDDVQWADPDSHRLLSRFATHVSGAPVLLVVLCREPLRDHTGATRAMLADLARLEPVRIRLTGLAEAEVRDVIQQRTGLPISESVAARVWARTDGNPFYVNELVRLLSEGGALNNVAEDAWDRVPDGIRDVVRHRVGELPPSVADALSAAAVLGRTFDLDVLEQSWRGDVEVLDESVETAMAAGLLVEDGIGRCRFAHALVRDTVYADLPAPSRRHAHARAAEALERRRVGHLDEHVSQLAEHYRLGGAAHVRSAWTYAVRAARIATDRGAYRDAAELLTSAADLLAADALATEVEGEQVAVALGVALRQSARVEEAWSPLAVAAESALRRGDAVAAARALLRVTDQVLWSWRTRPFTDEVAVTLWLRVVEALPPQEAGLRARCLAAAAVEVMHDPGGVRGQQWVDEAMETARRLGDSTTLVEVLQISVNALRGPDLLSQRMSLTDELVEMCARRGDERAVALALCKRAPSYSALGRPADALRDLARARTLAESYHLVQVLMVVHLGLAVLEQAAGEVEAAELSLTRAESIQSTITMAGAGVGLTQRASALFAQGRLAELEPTLREVTQRHPLARMFRELHGLALVSGGRLDELRAQVGAWPEQPELPRDYLWLSLTCARGLIWAALGDSEAVADLRVQLEPFAARVADGAMATFFLGSVSHTLGELALCGGDVTAARAYAIGALELHERLGWPSWTRLSADLLDRVRVRAGEVSPGLTRSGQRLGRPSS